MNNIGFWKSKKMKWLTLCFLICAWIIYFFMPRSLPEMEPPAKDAEHIHVVMNIDDNYAKFLSVTMISILMNSDKNLHFHILTDGISEKNLKKLKKLKQIRPFELEIINIDDERINQLPNYVSSTIISVANYRLLIPNIKKDLDKVIYVDVDLVFLTDIQKLWNIDVDDYYIAATADYVNNYRKTEWIDKLPIPRDHLYFNSGVMVMNLKKMREDNIVQKFFEDSTKYAELLVLPDQDILNITLASNVKYFDGIYNYMPEVHYIDKKTRDKLHDNAEVIHWAGLIKPWKLLGDAKAELFWKYAEYSPFYAEIKRGYYISIVKTLFSYLFSEQTAKKAGHKYLLFI